jgi:hypothetical protein
MLCRLYYFVVILPLLLTACNRPKSDSGTAQNETVTVSNQPLSVHTIITRSRDSSLSPRDTTHVFSPTDTIHGVIHSDHARDGTVIIGRWYFSNGQKVAENSTRLSAGPNISYFDLMSESPWPVGNYKLLILVDRNVVDSAQFAVVGKAVSKK